MKTRPSFVRAAALAAACAVLVLARPAAAYTSMLLDESLFGPSLDQIDGSPHELWNDHGSRAPLWFALDVGVVKGDGITTQSGWSGMILVGLPLDRIYKRSAGRAIADGPPALKPPPHAKVHEPDPGAPPLPPKVAPTTTPVDPIAIPVVVSPSLARAAVKAALKKAHLTEPGARTDALASRARSSAVLPELRLRAARIVDDGQSLLPTEYDPYRTTATGGTTLWLDARATWKLDRLVFADEEVALERIRNERVEAQTRLVGRVLEVLFAWQKWSARAGDGNATAEEHLAAELGVLQAEAELDILTDGWFTKWRAADQNRRAK